jgi:hypothetical protein
MKTVKNNILRFQILLCTYAVFFSTPALADVPACDRHVVYWGKASDNGGGIRPAATHQAKSAEIVLYPQEATAQRSEVTRYKIEAGLHPVGPTRYLKEETKHPSEPAPHPQELTPYPKEVTEYSKENTDYRREATQYPSKPQSPVPQGFLQIEAVSPEFTQEIIEAAATLPSAAINALMKAGYRIELSHSVPDAVPSSRNQQVRGYAPHSTWNDVFGMFNRTTSKIIMAQYAQLPDSHHKNDISQLTNRQRRLGILRHEFGHALDEYMGNFSHGASFKQVYEFERENITGDEKKTLSYYLQSGDAGREETFAELFAAHNGMGCDQVSDALLQERFPNLTQLIATQVASLK